MALAGFEPARCPTVSGPLCPLSYSAIYRPQRRYAPGWVRLSGGLFVVLTKALRPRLHRRCFVLPGQLLLFTACFAAWKVRPSGPDRGLHRAAAYKMEPFLPGVPCGILHPAPIAERSIFLEGSPPAGTHKRGNLLSVLYLTRYPRRGNGLAFGPWLVTARKGRKKEGAWGSYSLMLHCRIVFKVCVASWQHLKNFYRNFVLPAR